MLKYKASDLITETPSQTPLPPVLQSLSELFEWMSKDSAKAFSRRIEKLLYLYDKAVSVESRSASVDFVVEDDFDFSILRGVPFFYDRQIDSNGHYFLHFHVSTLLALLFYEKYSCYKQSR